MSPVGYFDDEEEECGNCRYEEFEEGDTYFDEDLNAEVTDVYCVNCGVVVEVVPEDEDQNTEEDNEDEE